MPEHETKYRLWSIAVEFTRLSRGREDEIKQRVEFYLASARARMQARRKSLSKCGKNSLERRQREREAGDKWDSENPIPEDVKTARVMATIVASVNAVLNQTSPEIAEDARLTRIVSPVGLDEVLLSDRDLTHDLNALEAVWHQVRATLEDDRIVGQEAAAKVAGVTSRTIRNWCKDSLVKGEKHNGILIFKRSELLRAKQGDFAQNA